MTRSVGALPDSAMIALAQDRRERLVQGGREAVAHELAGVNRGAGKRGLRMEPSGALHVDHAVDALVARRGRVEGAFQRVAGVGFGVVHHGVEGAADLGGGAGVVDVELVAALGDGDLEVDGFLAGAVEVDRAVIGAVGDCRDGVAHAAFGAGADFAGDRGEVVDALAAHEFAQARRGGVAGGDLGGDVADDLVGEARVGADDGLDVALGSPALNQSRAAAA